MHSPVRARTVAAAGLRFGVVAAVQAAIVLPALPTSAGGTKLTATCSITQAVDRVAIAVRVSNRTGETVGNVSPAAPMIGVRGSAALTVLTAPRPWRHLLPGKSVTLRWTGRVTGSGRIAVSTTVSATDAHGAGLSTGTVSCGGLTLGNPRQSTFTPTPTPENARRRPTATPRPTRTHRNTARTGRPVADARFLASCVITEAGNRLSIFARASNHTAGTLIDVHPLPLRIAATGGAALRLTTAPRVRTKLVPNNGVTFKWQGRLTGCGAIDVSPVIVAQSGNGKTLVTRARCRSVRRPCQSPTPVPQPTPTRVRVRAPVCHPRGGFMGHCWTRQMGNRVEIFVRADNGSASALRNVKPNPLQFKPTGTASLRLMTRRKVRRELICNNAVTFKWQGILRGTGTVTVAAEVVAAGPAGVPATTGILACGTFATEPTASAPEATR